MRTRYKILLLFIFIFIVSPLATIYADDQKPVIYVPVGNSQVLYIPNKIERIAIGNPEIIDAVAVTQTDVVFRGINVGWSFVHIWEKDGNSYTITVHSIDVMAIKPFLISGIYADFDMNKGIILEGETDDEDGYKRMLKELKMQFGDIFIDNVTILPPPPPPPALPDTFFLSDEEKNTINTGELQLTTKLISVISRSATDMKDAVTPLLSTNGSITVDAKSNTLIVKDLEENIETIEKFVRDLDQPTSLQVLIQAEFVEVIKDKIEELGIDFSATFGSANTLSFSVGNSLKTVVTRAGGATPSTSILDDQLGSEAQIDATSSNFNPLELSNLDLYLRALENKGYLRKLSSPKITALNQQLAKIVRTDKIHYISGYTFTYDSNGAITGAYPVISSVEIGITLEITPTIGRDDIISVKIKPIASNLIGGDIRTIQASAAGTTYSIQVPDMTTRSAEAEILVKNGYTFVIGGLRNYEEAFARQETPYLSKIPILGNLFKRKKDIDAKTELLIFITAQIIDSDGIYKSTGNYEYIPQSELKSIYQQSVTNPALNQREVEDTTLPRLPLKKDSDVPVIDLTK
ncbi:MAG: pilus assembly protein N-terminal domain-containing protein [Candidatus Hydrogenedentota bacterium]